eukprot:g2804.t1
MWQMQVAERKPYDFVHLPWSKLAVVNFTSPEACVVCFDIMKMVAGMPGVNITDVCEALHHGLAANLAHFITKSQQASKISMPLVFISGHRVPPLLACRLVSDQLLQQQSFVQRQARRQDGKANGPMPVCAGKSRSCEK